MNRIATYVRQTLQEIYPPEEAKALSMMVCCDMLGMSATDIYVGKDITLSASEQRELENILIRLLKNEPIQYIRGVAQFAGRMFKVTPDVLIPRPETVELVELVAKENLDACRLLDIGTGSGCIAISLDKLLPNAKVEAWDVSEAALTVARENNQMQDAAVDFQLRDVLSDEWKATLQYDVIVSNPPYVTEAEKEGMDANVLDWEPALALFVPNEDPLRFYRRIARLGRNLLVPDGKLYFEINRAYPDETARMLEENGYRNIRIIKDIFGKDRIVTANR